MIYFVHKIHLLCYAKLVIACHVINHSIIFILGYEAHTNSRKNKVNGQRDGNNTER